MTAPGLVRRRAQRAAALRAARQQADAAEAGLPVRAVVLFGSYARGDFHDASDVDVLVLVDGPLPGRPQERLALVEPRPAGVEPVVWTVEEFRRRSRKGDLIAREACEVGVWVSGSVEDVLAPRSRDEQRETGDTTSK